MTPIHAVRVALSLRLARRQRHASAREDVRAALRASAELAGAPRALPCEDWPRNAAGAPEPVQGWHASLADTTGFALAAVAPVALGLDVEWLARPRWEAARERFQESGELATLGSDGRATVLALWTAKEALLKLVGVGLADLARCALVARTLEGEVQRFVLRHGDLEQVVRVHTIGRHLVALAARDSIAFHLHELQEAT